MSPYSWHSILTWVELGLAAVTFVTLWFITAPYGRHGRAGWGPTLPSRLGWIVMESPAVLAFAVIFAYGEHRHEAVPLVLLALWQTHYLHRTVIYPFRMRARGKRMPVFIAGSAIAFNLLNAYVNARWISHIGQYQLDWLRDPRFLGGAALFIAGMAVNIRADSVLFSLREESDTSGGYRIPRGGLYERVSCPNYLGELMEWLGWALATWSLAGLAFAAYTAANLVPRAVAHHRWYHETFDDYPAERKALIPYVL